MENKINLKSFSAFMAQISENKNQEDLIKGILAQNQLIMYFTAHDPVTKEERVYGSTDEERISYRDMLQSKHEKKPDALDFFTAIDLKTKIKNPDDKSKRIFNKKNIKDIQIIQIEDVFKLLKNVKASNTINGSKPELLQLRDKKADEE